MFKRCHWFGGSWLSWLQQENWLNPQQKLSLLKINVSIRTKFSGTLNDKDFTMIVFLNLMKTWMLWLSRSNLDFCAISTSFIAYISKYCIDFNINLPKTVGLKWLLFLPRNFSSIFFFQMPNPSAFLSMPLTKPSNTVSLHSLLPSWGTPQVKGLILNLVFDLFYLFFFAF